MEFCPKCNMVMTYHHMDDGKEVFYCSRCEKQYKEVSFSKFVEA